MLKTNHTKALLKYFHIIQWVPKWIQIFIITIAIIIFYKNIALFPCLSDSYFTDINLAMDQLISSTNMHNKEHYTNST